jgi:predicted HTH transcriptional regulator
MSSPKNVFDDPQQYWNFLTASADEDFESQYFDRKEAGRTGEHGSVSKAQVNHVIDLITECVSAFANANKGGGLLVLGISKSGEIKGINHLNDAQRTRITRACRHLADSQAWLELLHDAADSG